MQIVRSFFKLLREFSENVNLNTYGIVHILFSNYWTTKRL